MESFKYYIKIDINFNLKEQVNLISPFDKEWSFFNFSPISSVSNFKNEHTDEDENNCLKKIIIKKNIGKLIGFGGDTISKIRRENKDVIIKINGSNNENYNREVILSGSSNSINNIINEIKTILGTENVIY